MGCTLNDVLMAALGAALRTWATKDKGLSDMEVHDLLTVMWVSSLPLSEVRKYCFSATFGLY